ncbi:MAG: threonine synthase, partial [Firmicutes bacterium]|nr:threonine synthase [Bacillota bacterium]
MKYISTRSRGISCDGLQAVLAGMAPDGGLFLPESFDKISFDYKSCALGCSAKEIATKVIGAILPDFDDMAALVERAYTGKFETEDLTPLVKVGNKYVLELFRGPTSAFKDVALSMLPQLISAAKKQTGDSSRTLILTATSGDTGKAALEGFHDVPGVGIIVFFPENGVSEVQKLQMVT